MFDWQDELKKTLDQFVTVPTTVIITMIHLETVWKVNYYITTFGERVRNEKSRFRQSSGNQIIVKPSHRKVIEDLSRVNVSADADADTISELCSKPSHSKRNIYICIGWDDNGDDDDVDDDDDDDNKANYQSYIINCRILPLVELRVCRNI